MQIYEIAAKKVEFLPVNGEHVVRDLSHKIGTLLRNRNVDDVVYEPFITWDQFILVTE